MTNREKLEAMFKLQRSLNDATNGKGWENGYTKTNNIINWRRCIYMECAELVDSFQWKHWKDLKKPIDWENVRVEIVDIWHFIMSLILEHYKHDNLGDIDTIVANIENAQGFKEFCSDPFNIKAANSFEIINDTEVIIHKATAKGYTKFDPMLVEYFTLSLKCGINLSLLYQYYIAKNVLNHFRQNNGYKDGSYKKIWNGKEDNTVMLEILKSGLQDIDEIYQKLEEVYKKAI
ncbi:MAG: dUTP diphosphatase [Campylobacteraceae bacterium]|jgi:dimeric dUTPase (all-alpha-NTP-PPase superfamily)|nr:dUTP diphosphatase [Campylobacteraceae bacterium]